MQEKAKYILVLGSKPDSNMPLIEVSHVYSANGAIEKTPLLNQDSDFMLFRLTGHHNILCCCACFYVSNFVFKNCYLTREIIDAACSIY